MRYFDYLKEDFDSSLALPTTETYVYDRGTKFGLMTGGNQDAIYVSLPLAVK